MFLSKYSSTGSRLTGALRSTKSISKGRDLLACKPGQLQLKLVRSKVTIRLASISSKVGVEIQL